MNDIDIERARFNMVEQQVRTWEVLDEKVLDLFRTIPREEFVPKHLRKLAFADMQLPLPHGQFMMEPKIEAKVLQALAIEPDDQILEIGTGSGFLTACLARLGKHVTSVEIQPELHEQAAQTLKAQGFDNVKLLQGDAAAGWNDGRRYDVIAVTGSLPELHRGFHDSLAVGGRMFVVVGEAPVMEGLLITRVSEDQWASESILETVLPPLINAPKTLRFAV